LLCHHAGYPVRTELQAKYKLFARTSSPEADYTRPHRRPGGVVLPIHRHHHHHDNMKSAAKRRDGNASEKTVADGVAGAARYN
jgi:hypothetical protein